MVKKSMAAGGSLLYSRPIYIVNVITAAFHLNFMSKNRPGTLRTRPSGRKTVRTGRRTGRPKTSAETRPSLGVLFIGAPAALRAGLRQ